MKFYVRTSVSPKMTEFPAQFGTKPVEMMCPKCGVHMETETSFEIPVKSHVIACILCVLFCPLAWVPYYFGVSMETN